MLETEKEGKSRIPIFSEKGKKISIFKLSVSRKKEEKNRKCLHLITTEQHGEDPGHREQEGKTWGGNISYQPCHLFIHMIISMIITINIIAIFQWESVRKIVTLNPHPILHNRRQSLGLWH